MVDAAAHKDRELALGRARTLMLVTTCFLLGEVLDEQSHDGGRQVMLQLFASMVSSSLL